MSLDDVITGVVKKPRRLLVYGVPSVGKTTFAAQAPNPIFIPTEEGANDLDVAKFPLVKSYDEFVNRLRELVKGGHGYETVVIDTLGALDLLIIKHLCEKEKKGYTALEDWGFGRGPELAKALWNQVCSMLDHLKDQGMTIVMLAHAHVKHFTPPDSDGYDRYEPNFTKKCAALMVGWSDEVFFANFVVRTKQTSAGKTQGVGQGKRVMFCQERPAYNAKNRLGMKPETDFTWSEYQDAITNPQPFKGN